MKKNKHQFTLGASMPFATGGVSFGPLVQPYNNLIYSGLGGDIGSPDGMVGSEGSNGSSMPGAGDQDGSFGEGTDAGGAGSAGAAATAM